MIGSKKDLVEGFKNDPTIIELMQEGNLEKVARLATAMGTAGGSPELRRYGKELWEKHLGASEGSP